MGKGRKPYKQYDPNFILKVADHIANGWTTKEIVEAYGTTDGYVRRCMSELLQASDTRNRVEFALKHRGLEFKRPGEGERNELL